jgi:hypothetical protein
MVTLSFSPFAAQPVYNRADLIMGGYTPPSREQKSGTASTGGADLVASSCFLLQCSTDLLRSMRALEPLLYCMHARAALHIASIVGRLCMGQVELFLLGSGLI